MSYELEIQKSLPVAINTLNGTCPPLVAGSGTASLFTTNTTDNSFGGWVKGREDSPFSIEFWALPLTVTGPSLLMIGHTLEGLFYDGSDYILRLQYAGAGTIEGRWREPEIKAHHFVITYDLALASLYVDGERVIIIELPQQDTFTNTNATININYSNGSGIYDSLAFYYRTLPLQEIKEHYALGRAVDSSVAIASSKGATTWSLTYADVDIEQTVTYNSTNWDKGFFTDTSYRDRLGADVAGGTWQVAIPLGAMTTSTAGVHLRFVGESVELEWSTDAVTWGGIENKTTILEDISPTDLILYIRLTLINEDSWVESLTTDILRNRVMQPFSGSRQLSFKDVEMDEIPGVQLEYQSDMGAQIRNDGYISISPDTQDTPTLMKVVEMWVKYDELTNTTLVELSGLRVRIDSGTLRIGAGVTVKINDVVATNNVTTVSVGQWNFFQIVFPIATNDEVRIGRNQDGSFPGDLTVYGIALYPDVPSGSYQANVGIPGLRVDDTGGFSLSESATPYDIYAYSWSIVSGSS